VNATESK